MIKGTPLLLLLAVGQTGLCAPARKDVWVLGDFEEQSWPGLERSSEQAHSGHFSGKWIPKKMGSSLLAPGFPADLSSYGRLLFSLYSAKANGQRLTLVLDSDNSATPAGWDYYYFHFTVNWTGWKSFDLRFGSDIQPTRNPVGWHHITALGFHAGGWQHTPLPDTILYLDDVKLVRETVTIASRRKPEEAPPPPGKAVASWTVTVTNRTDTPRAIPLKTILPHNMDAVVLIRGIPAQTQKLPAGSKAVYAVSLVADTADVPPLTRFRVDIEARPVDPKAPAATTSLELVVPIPPRRHPFLFGDAALFRHARSRTSRLPWAKKEYDRIVSTAEKNVQHPVEIPAEAGQWPHHYVCKKCGSRLVYRPPNHVCPRCKAEYHGWPYDQVVAGNRHGRNFRQARDMALAYALTEREEFAVRARDILLGYAQRYPSWPLHNTRGKLSNSAGRVFAQTLDEACALIGLAWAYDLIYPSPCLDARSRQHIENDLLRAMVHTIRRNNAGISNWQSWHNAGIAAVGFCLQDSTMIAQALNGKSGLEYQLGASILKDGFWYEGTAAYHFYALNALRWTVEAAWFAGIDYWNNAAYRSLYLAPLLYTFPDLTFPAVNDSDVFSIKGQHGLYELAYVRTGDPRLLRVAQFGRRQDLEAFLYGPDHLPEAPDTPLQSHVFPGIGAAVLRGENRSGKLYLHLDYGPHGGGHGHPDKLTLILFGLGRQLAPDPGRLAYGAPLQGSWYRQTLAHNTVCVDGVSQHATTGKLTFFKEMPEGSVMQGESTGAYPGTTMRRTVALVAGLIIDVFELASDKEHTYDWVYHNVGRLQPGLALSPRPGPLGSKAGYQHVQQVEEARTDATWHIDFEQPNGRVRVTMAGTTGTRVFTGVGMMNNPPEPCPMILARRIAGHTCFVSAIEVTDATPGVRDIRLLDDREPDEIAVVVDLEKERIGMLLAPTPGPHRDLLGTRVAGRVCLVRQPR